jgi:glucans biosynthesis protein C
VPHSDRHYGLDWLRIAAFGLLIAYHVGMVFAPWPWVIKSNPTYPALVGPMAVLTPWRLPLLFAIAGYASRKLFARAGTARAFLGQRNLRLLLPLAFGVLVLLPPEVWVRARLAGYGGDLIRFWAVDGWRPGTPWGLPQWEHLWFVLYLWAYTVLLAGLVGWRGADWWQARAEWLTTGRRLVWCSPAALVIAKLAMLFVVPEEQGLFRDWTAHAEYLPIFLWGFALGGSPALWEAVGRAWRASALLAVAGGAVVLWVELTWQGAHVPPHAVMALDRAARLLMAWSACVALFHLADRWLDRDAPARRGLGEAVFPFYLVHHPVLVLLAWATLPLGLPPVAEFVLLLAGTGAGCAAFYLAGREIAWLRPLIGLAPRPRDLVGSRAPA